MSKCRKQLYPRFSVWNAVDDALHSLLKGGWRAGQHVFGAAEDQGRRLDVRPVVDYRVKIDNTVEERLYTSQARPVRAECPRVPDPDVGLKSGVPRGRPVCDVPHYACPNRLIRGGERKLVGFLGIGCRPS